jgi:hypothetical protein
MQNRPRFDARNKQPGRAARHPIPAPDFRVANRVHARAGFRLKNGRNGFILHRRFRRGLRARRKDGQLFVIPTGLVMRVGAT